MGRRSGLGRGLGALIPPEVEGGGALRELPVASIQPNRHQPRDHFDEESLVALTASVRELGVLQPVLVRPLDVDDGADDVTGERFELIAGERRWRAAKRAGLATVPAVVRQVGDLGALEHAVVENLHREDLSPLEEAAAYQQLIEDFGLTHDQVATRVGRSRSAITNALRLFQLPPAIQRLVGEGRVSAGHARALLGTPDRTFQETLAHRIAEEGLSVRAVEEAVRDHERRDEGEPAGTAEPAGEDAATAPGSSQPRGSRLRPPGLLELEELLSELLATRVRVDMSAKKGKVVIEFADLEDLERIYRTMTGA